MYMKNDDSPFCQACAEPRCSFSQEGTCEMIRKYTNATMQCGNCKTYVPHETEKGVGSCQSTTADVTDILKRKFGNTSQFLFLFLFPETDTACASFEPKINKIDERSHLEPGDKKEKK